MKASRYNILVKNSEKETILFNSLYGSMSVLDTVGLGDAMKLLSNPIPGDSAGMYASLVEHKYLVEDTVDELELVRRRKMAGIRDHNRLDLFIMPTLDCNMACAYCYESHIPSMMSEETAEAIIKWIKRELPNYKLITLQWFGGEPMLGFQQVVRISREVRDLASSLGVSCILHMTTNGYLFNEERIREIIASGIWDFQITLDGPPATHDRLRVRRDGKGTFDRIFQNIISLVRADRKVRVTLRVNFNHSNLHEIPTLLEMFPEDVREQLRVLFAPIFGDCRVSATVNLPAEEISASVDKHHRLAESLGYDVVMGKSIIEPGRLVYCYAERENQYIINYNADVYKCTVGGFHPETRVACLTPDGVMIREEEKWEQWVGRELFEESCLSCVYLPLCMGGCRKARMDHQGRGSHCSLIPTNTTYFLKQVALGGLNTLLREGLGRARCVEPI